MDTYVQELMAIADNLIELQTGEIEIVGRIVDASNASIYCKVGEVSAIYKPIAGERPLWDFPNDHLAWREVARVKNSANCNLLILDEVFDSSLDAVGAEEFMKLLTGLDSKTNIFVISHKDTMVDRFQRTIRFEKIKNFSTLTKET